MENTQDTEIKNSSSLAKIKETPYYPTTAFETYCQASDRPDFSSPGPENLQQRQEQRRQEEQVQKATGLKIWKESDLDSIIPVEEWQKPVLGFYLAGLGCQSRMSKKEKGSIQAPENIMWYPYLENPETDAGKRFGNLALHYRAGAQLECMSQGMDMNKAPEIFYPIEKKIGQYYLSKIVQEK